MKKLLTTISLSVGILFSQLTFAQTTPKAPQVDAKSYILQDFHSGRILAEKNPSMEVDPASITKMMTAYVVFSELKAGHLNLDDKVTVSEKAWRTGGSKMFIEVNKKITIDDLIHGMIIQSGNDACVALAEHIAGSEEVFADMMNQHANKLGMEHSHFVNSTGLPHENHHVSAADIAKLGAAIVRDFPQWYPIFAQKEFTFNNIKQNNRNALLWRDKSVDGFKTGHTEAAGYCLATSAERNGMRLISVVMGTDSEKSRANETQKLLNYGFRFYETHKLFNGGDERVKVELWKSDQEQLSVGLKDDLFITIPKGQYQQLDAKVELPNKLVAPIVLHQQLGQLNVTLNGQTVARRPLVALTAAPTAGWWTRTIDSIGLWFSSFGDDE